MPDTITALDTASTDELIAALRSRLRATLGQSCGHLTDLDACYAAADGIGKALAFRLVRELREDVSSYLIEHPSVKGADSNTLADWLLRLLERNRPAESRPQGSPFRFPPGFS